jgi:uncharacterized caspase-like protein
MSEVVHAFPDHFLSIFQSAAAEFDRRAAKLGAPKGVGDQPTMTTEATKACAARMQGVIDDGPGQPKALPKTISSCALLGLHYLEARIKGDQATVDTIRSQYQDSQCDIGWLTTIDEYLRYFGPGGSRLRIPYRRAQAAEPKVITIKSHARIGIVGDWGTGGDAARRIAWQMAQLKPDILVHLGDIYYSGTVAECKENFTDIIDSEFERVTTKLPVFTITGNHDMYSGGEGFYNLIDGLNDGAMKQTASYFCLRTADGAWQMLGMDTGYNDYSPLSVLDNLTFIEADEEDWHVERIREFPGKTILLSHHQPFSAFAQIGSASADGDLLPHNPRLLASHRRFRATGRDIPMWLWGHEHSLSIYEPYEGVERGRCIGHGGIPVLSGEEPYRPLAGLRRPVPRLRGPRPALAGGAFPNGFAMLSLAENKIDYYQDKNGVGSKFYSEPASGQLLDDDQDQGAEVVSEEELFAPSGDVTPGKKFAFVLGNSRYRSVPQLDNPAVDARAVRLKLQELGFQVYGGTNFELSAIERHFDRFEALAEGAEVVTLYYSGHGVQIGGESYLIPTDGTLASLQQPSQAIKVQALTTRLLRKAKRCLVFLDACRDNPFLQTLDTLGPTALAKGIPTPHQAATDTDVSGLVARGLAPIDVAEDAEAFIAFAASPGKFAYGSDGEFSRFTNAFLRHAETEGLNLDGVMRRITNDVRADTNGAQCPWSQSNLSKNYFFKPASWQPVYTMGLMGAVAGLITAHLTFNEDALFDYRYFGVGIFFAIVMGYGVWRWGRRSLWDAAVAVVAGTLFFELGSFFLWWIGTFTTRSDLTTASFFQNARLMRDVIGAEIAGPVVVFGCVLAGAITTPALRRLRVYTAAAVCGAVVALIFVTVLFLQHFILGEDASVGALKIFDYAGAALWQGLLGACIGYGLSQYVPELPERKLSGAS